MDRMASAEVVIEEAMFVLAATITRDVLILPPHLAMHACGDRPLGALHNSRLLDFISACVQGSNVSSTNGPGL